MPFCVVRQYQATAVGRWEPELTSALAAAAADEDEPGGSAGSHRTSSPAPRVRAAQDTPHGGTRRAEL